MIVAFISTDIVIVNRSTRMDDPKKILNIIWNSLEKIEQTRFTENSENCLDSTD